MPLLDFQKVEATRNDFVLLDGDEPVPQDMGDWSRSACDRRSGVGADGVLVVGTRPHPWMRMWNPDGSEAETCGNGLRCAALLLDTKGLDLDRWTPVMTLGGPTNCRIPDRGSDHIWVDLRFAPPEVSQPMPLPWSKASGIPVDLGNPHLVHRVEDLSASPLKDWGQKSQDLFPEGANLELVQIQTRNHLRMRVYERGAGETQSCGSGCIAGVAAAVSQDWVAPGAITVDLPGGTVEVIWRGPGADIVLVGPARLCFHGQIDCRMPLEMESCP